MTAFDVRSSRFSGDQQLLAELMTDPRMERELAITRANRTQDSMRARLLGNAVAVNPEVLPHLSDAFKQLTERVPDLGEVECYVYNDPTINAFVTQGRTRTLIALSSGAVNGLDTQELGYVIGHELGHALFEHLELEVGRLTAQGDFGPSACMKLRAWQRAAEISADRVGLVACGSIDVAASALFKTVSGLVVPGFFIQPDEFADQWQHLLDEVIGDGERDHWQVSHPFPPLRMCAMLAFWEAYEAGASAEALAKADAGVQRMLAMMDPSAGKGSLQDPLLASFFFWGGLYIALADRYLDPGEVQRLQTVAPSGIDVHALGEEPEATDARCLEGFASGLKDRRKKLTAVELHRIVFGLIDVAAADGHISDEEMQRLYELGKAIGIPPAACDLIKSQYQEEMGNDA